MTTKDLITSTFEQLRRDCVDNNNLNISGYTAEDIFLDAIEYVLLSDKKLLSYEDLRDFVQKRMRTARYYRFKTYYSYKTISLNAIHQKTKEDEQQ